MKPPVVVKPPVETKVPTDRKQELLNMLRDISKDLLKNHNAKSITVTDEGITITPRQVEVLKISF